MSATTLEVSPTCQVLDLAVDSQSKPVAPGDPPPTYSPNLEMKALLLTLLAACAPTPIKVVTPADLPPAPVFEPRVQRRVVTETSIEIYETIQFVGNTAIIAEASLPMLDTVAAMMRVNTSITLLEIRGHSDWEEPDRVRRAELSIERAEHVVAALIARGVEPGRLTAYGASDSEPLSTVDPVLNRRIELRILQRDSD